MGGGRWYYLVGEAGRDEEGFGSGRSRLGPNGGPLLANASQHSRYGYQSPNTKSTQRSGEIKYHIITECQPLSLFSILIPHRKGNRYQTPRILSSLYESPLSRHYNYN